MHLPYFGQDLESKIKVVGILAHVCFPLLGTFNASYEIGLKSLTYFKWALIYNLEKHLCVFFPP